jgi:hypothetical protein
VAPTDIRFYVTLVVLIYFLILRIPGLWAHIVADRPTGEEGETGLGAAAILAGALALTVQFWAGDVHIIGGVNYADIWHVPLGVLGWTLVAAGAGSLSLPWLRRLHRRTRHLPLARRASA